MQATKMESFVERNLDLTRKLLKAIEKEPKYNGRQWYRPDREADNLGIIGRGEYSDEEVAYNLNRLIETGFVAGKIEADESMPLIKRLTWDGHEFSANITDDGIWERTKEAANKLPGMGLKFVAELAEQEVKKYLGLS